MMIPKETIDEIQNRADIVEIISDHISGLKKSGSNYKALSPFTNEKTPSFVVSPDKQIFKDFSSNKGGSVFKFLQEYLNISFPEAVEIVAEKVGIKIEKGKYDPKEQTEIDQMRTAMEVAANFYHENLLKNMDKPYTYLVERGFSMDVMQKFLIGYSPDEWETSYNYMRSKGISDKILEDVGLFRKSKRGSYYDYFKGRIIFPIKNKLGRIIGFGGRVFGENNNGPKYLNSPQTKLYDKSNVLYGLHESIDSIRNSEKCIIVEGYADVISLHEVGVSNVVAASGTALTPNQLDLIKNSANKIYLIFDADKAGINAAERSIDIALSKGLEVEIVNLPDGEDPDSIAQKHGKKTFDIHLNKSMNFIEFKKWAFEWKYGELSINHRSELIRSIISSLKRISDVFTRGGYLNLAERVLNLSKFESDEFYRAIQKESQKENIKKVNLPDQVESQDNKLIIDESEKLIITSILDHFVQTHKILETVNFSAEDFITDDGRSLFETLMQIPTDQEKPLIYLEDNDEVPQRDKDLLFTLSLIDRTPNEKLFESKFSSKPNYEKLIMDCIEKLKLKKIEIEEENIINDIPNSEDVTAKFERLSEIKLQKEKIIQELGATF